MGIAYRIIGGAPAGISIPPGVDGCRTTRTKINIITIQGNKSTAPSGMDIFEFPFKRIRRRKKASPGDIRSFCRERSPKEGSFSREGRFGDEGILFAIFCTNPIYAAIHEMCYEGATIMYCTVVGRDAAAS